MNTEQISNQAAYAMAELANAIKAVESLRTSSVHQRDLLLGQFEAHIGCAKHHVLDGMMAMFAADIEPIGITVDADATPETRSALVAMAELAREAAISGVFDSQNAKEHPTAEAK